MAISIDLRGKHDSRAQELGFSDRHSHRNAIRQVAEALGEEEYMKLSNENLEIVLKVLARLQS